MTASVPSSPATNPTAASVAAVRRLTCHKSS